jgi:hypothetical protein
VQMSTEIIRPFADWIARTELSGVLGKYDWIVPTSQSLHIVCVALLFIGTLIISLRLIGLRESDHSLSVDVRRLTRLVYGIRWSFVYRDVANHSRTRSAIRRTDILGEDVFSFAGPCDVALVRDEGIS